MTPPSLVVDTSAAVAILTAEPVAGHLADLLGSAGQRSISAASVVELGIVLGARLGPSGRGMLDRFLREGAVEVVPLDRAQVDLALDGWHRYGRGRHRAALNLGDCFSYGLARHLRAPIVCTGDDFAHTDLEVLRPPSTATP